MIVAAIRCESQLKWCVSAVTSSPTVSASSWFYMRMDSSGNIKIISFASPDWVSVSIDLTDVVLVNTKYLSESVFLFQEREIRPSALQVVCLTFIQ